MIRDLFWSFLAMNPAEWFLTIMGTILVILAIVSGVVYSRETKTQVKKRSPAARHGYALPDVQVSAQRRPELSPFSPACLSQKEDSMERTVHFLPTEISDFETNLEALRRISRGLRTTIPEHVAVRMDSCLTHCMEILARAKQAAAKTEDGHPVG